jgi:hypothetical protein
MTGQVLCNTNNINELEAVLNGLSSGVYQLKITSDKGNQTVKVILTK